MGIDDIVEEGVKNSNVWEKGRRSHYRARFAPTGYAGCKRSYTRLPLCESKGLSPETLVFTMFCLTNNFNTKVTIRYVESKIIEIKKKYCQRIQIGI
jgi:hypothetical protein